MSASVSGKKNKPRERVEAREQTILSAATAVFTTSGVDGATMAEIARRAQIAEGTLYLYHKNKQDLLAVVVERFWADLTEGALSAVNTEEPVMAQLQQLAAYHLTELINQSDLVGLTYRARLRHGEPEYQLPKIREYVRVFDRIVERGIDRGELKADLVLWQCRDVFFGTLEHSARTLRLRDAGFDASIIQQLIKMLKIYQVEDQATTALTSDNEKILARLSSIENQLAEIRSS
jgi:TetR/AcrR family fatty acid metabolism transcriptional regulator